MQTANKTTVALLLAEAMKANNDSSEILAIEMRYAMQSRSNLELHTPLDIDRLQDAPEYTAYSEEYIYTSGFDLAGEFVTMSMPYKPDAESIALADKLKAEGLL